MHCSDTFWALPKRSFCPCIVPINFAHSLVLVWTKTPKNINNPFFRGAENVIAEMASGKVLILISGVCQIGILGEIDIIDQIHNGRLPADRLISEMFQSDQKWVISHINRKII